MPTEPIKSAARRGGDHGRQAPPLLVNQQQVAVGPFVVRMNSKNATDVRLFAKLIPLQKPSTMLQPPIWSASASTTANGKNAVSGGKELDETRWKTHEMDSWPQGIGGTLGLQGGGDSTCTSTKCVATTFRSRSFADGKESGRGMGNQRLIKAGPTLAVAAILPDGSHVGASADRNRAAPFRISGSAWLRKSGYMRGYILQEIEERCSKPAPCQSWVRSRSLISIFSIELTGKTKIPMYVEGW